MKTKGAAIFIAGIIATAVMLHPGIVSAQDNATTAVQGKMYVCYFYYQDGMQNTELTFNSRAYVSVMDGMGYGLYFTAGSFFAGYYLVLNAPIWRAARLIETQDDLIDTSDILTVMSGIATGVTIQGAGVTWTDFKNRRPFTFFGYQHLSQ
jgi:hypothetical protein